MAETASLHEIYKAIGALTAEVASLRRDIQESDQRQDAGAKRADEHRAVVHRRVDELVTEVGGLKTKVTAMQATVDDSKAVTDEVKKWKAQGTGALFVAGIAGSAITAVIAYFGESILRLLR